MPKKDRVAQRPGSPSRAGFARDGVEAPSAVGSAVQAWVAADPKSLHLLEQARKIAAGTSTVLISGESGVGKDLLASLLHYLGPHPQEPLVKIDCASLPHELVESELFGYEKGAFTGATQTKRGRLELAGAGTIVLDEVAALPLAVQAKLLRALEEKSFHRLGGTHAVHVAARIVALTNADLAEAVARGAFREDLYYRLNVLPLSIPPLRERPADIRPLARRLLSQLAEPHRGPARMFSADALAALERYPFPGNVRELRNILERALVASSAPEISLDALPAHVRQAAQGRDRHKMTLEEMERAYIAEILDYTRGKKSKAAAILGISRKNLLEKRKRYGLD